MSHVRHVVRRSTLGFALVISCGLLVMPLLVQPHPLTTAAVAAIR